VDAAVKAAELDRSLGSFSFKGSNSFYPIFRYLPITSHVFLRDCVTNFFHLVFFKGLCHKFFSLSFLAAIFTQRSWLVESQFRRYWLMCTWARYPLFLYSGWRIQRRQRWPLRSGMLGEGFICISILHFKCLILKPGLIPSDKSYLHLLSTWSRKV